MTYFPFRLCWHLFPTHEESYYRSKLFNARTGINPLIAAASPLFSLSVLLETAEIRSQHVESFYKNLQHEIKAFENNAKMEKYHSATILTARYILCAYLDELLFNIFPDWRTYSLLMHFHQELNSSERFFLILDKLTQDPECHIDLLEFIYLCLNLGYQGKYGLQLKSKENLHEITTHLFECIRRERGDLKKELHVAPSEKPRPVPIKYRFPLWLTIIFTIALSITIYSSFSYMLSHTVQMLYQEIQSIV